MRKEDGRVLYQLGKLHGAIQATMAFVDVHKLGITREEIADALLTYSTLDGEEARNSIKKRIEDLTKNHNR